MLFEISEKEAEAILAGLGWAYSEGDEEPAFDAADLVERLREAYPALTDKHTYLPTAQ